MAQQGWDKADFHCGRCRHTFTATTEEEYVRLYAEHKATCPATAGQRESAAVLRAMARSCEVIAAVHPPRWTARSLIAELRATADRLESV